MKPVQAKYGILMVAAVVMGALLLLGGCSSGTEREFPDYVYRSSQSLRGYQLAVENQEMLTHLPCYCGCGQDPAYKNLKNCFISDDGQFNSHGANCLICIEETIDATAWKEQGLSLKEIRSKIDAKYEGRGTPTDTAPVED